MNKVLFIASLLAACSHVAALEGCLKLSSANTCLFCDSAAGFALSNNQCIRVTDDRCVQTDQYGRCIECKQGFYLDATNSACNELKPNILNCRTYLSPTTCGVCEPGFEIEDGSCTQIRDGAIPNCQIQSHGKCQKCFAGFVLGLSGDSCNENPNVPNCAFYGSAKCDRCANRYITNPNLYLHNIFGFQFNNQVSLLQQFLTDQRSGEIDHFSADVCEQGDDANCNVFSDNGKCLECRAGYFVDQKGACIENLVESIPFCTRYHSLKRCVECLVNYQLSEHGGCEPVMTVPNCISYQRAVGLQGCVECADGFRLLGKTCVPRNAQIPQCKQLSVDSDTCVGCNDGFITSDDMQKCLPVVNNCAKYNPSSKNSAALRCETCNMGFFLNRKDGSCVKGSDPNCLIFENSADICAVCQGKYFNNQGVCMDRDVINGCQSYHFLSKGVCNSCKSSAYLNENVATCDVIPRNYIIRSCKYYANESTCAMCQEGYTLANNMCNVIPTALNCLKIRNDYCIKCLRDFVNDNGVCRQPFDRVVINCERSNVDGFVTYDTNTCSICKQNFFPVNHRNAFICTENKFLELRQGASLNPDCLQYEQVSAKEFRCAKCVNSKFLSNGQCVASCPVDQTAYLQFIQSEVAVGNSRVDTFRVKYINFCSTKIANCAVAAPDINQPFPVNPRYTCVQCDSGSIRVTDSLSPSASLIVSPSINIFDRSNSETLRFFTPVTVSPGFVCVNVATNSPVSVIPSTPSVPGLSQPPKIKTLGSFVNNQVNNCDLYAVVEPGIGCQKCNFGFSGNVLNVVNQCLEYKNPFSCSRCNQGFFLATEYECQRVVPISYCVTYEPTATSTICTACSASYYVNLPTNTCLPRVKSLSVSNSAPVLTADDVTCNANFYKVASTTATTTHSCIPKKPNCEIQTPSGSDYTCDKCNAAVSYISTTTPKTCILGTIANCVEYQQGGAVNTCTKCAPLFYLSSGTSCQPHAPAQNPNCAVFHLSKPNDCQTCKPDSIPFYLSNYCKAAVPIASCVDYLDQNTCKKCKAGMRLTNLSTACILIPAGDNCLEQEIADLDSTPGITNADVNTQSEYIYSCLKCKSGYTRVTETVEVIRINTVNKVNISVSVCRDWLSYKLLNCALHDVNDAQDFTKTCLACNAQTQPMDLSGKSICVENAYLKQAATPIVNVDNCKGYDWDSANSKNKCKTCSHKYVLDVTKCERYCVSATQSAIVRGFIIDTAAGKYTIEPQVCIDSTSLSPQPTVSNCDKFTPKIINSSGTISYACIECKKDYLPTYSFRGSGVPFDYTVTDEVKTPFDAYPEIQKCVAVAKFKARTSQSTVSSIPNCRYYTHLSTDSTTGDEYVGCVACNYQYSGPIVEFGSLGFIAECTMMPTSGAGGCKPNSLLASGSGLGVSAERLGNSSPLTLFYSCLECALSTEIPIVGMKYDSAQNAFVQYLSYDSSGTPSFVSGTVKKSPQTFCGTVAALPANCGLAVINTGAASTTQPNLSYICTACKPGYYPTFLKDVNNNNAPLYNIVSECTAIPNCPASSPGSAFNLCSGCVLEYDYLNSVVKPESCISTTNTDFIASCFAGNANGKCVICNKGYDFNHNFECVKTAVPGCAVANLKNPLIDFNLRFNNNLPAKAIYPRSLANISVYFLNDETGCASCNAGFSLIPLFGGTGKSADIQVNVCVSKSLSAPADYNIDNCVGLDIASTKESKKCKVCATGYVLASTFTACIPQAGNNYLSNCSVAVVGTRTQCKDCADPVAYINIGGMCVLRASAHPNCKTFASNDFSTVAQAQCNECNPGYYPSSDKLRCIKIPDTFPNCIKLDSMNYNTCAQCSDGFVLTTIADAKKYCFPFVFDSMFDKSCLAYDDAKFNEKKLECTKCKQDFFLVSGSPYATNANFQYCSRFSTKTDPNCKAYDAPLVADNTDLLSTKKLRCTTCVDTNKFFLDPISNLCVARTFTDPNCQQYVFEADQCMNCGPNLVLEPLLKRTCIQPSFLSNFNSNNKAYLQSCSAMPACSVNIFFQGLTKKIASLLSCHQCATSGQIPFLVGKGAWPYQEILSLQAYSLGASGRYMDGQGEDSVRCLEPAAGTFKIPAQQFAFPAGCGVGFLNANAANDASHSNLAAAVNRSKIAAICVACAPGFKAAPAFDANGVLVKDMVSSCTAIANCETNSKWFNYCSQCQINYVYSYDPVRGVNYDECVLYEANPFCLAVERLANPSAIRCRFCKAGYVLNRDGFCEIMKTPRCSELTTLHVAYQTRDLQTGLTLARDGQGCQQCQENFVGVFNTTSQNICTESPYVERQQLPVDSRVINFCRLYRLVQKRGVFCASCHPGYSLTLEGRCVDAQAKPKCNIAFDALNCHTCNPASSANIDHSCDAQAVTGCVEYAPSFFTSTPICTRCDAGFFLYANACHQNTVMNCDVAESNSTCSRCAPDYTRIRLANMTDYCFRNDPNMMCSALDEVLFQNGKLSCRSCKSSLSQFVNRDISAKSYCMDVTQIPFCLTYDVQKYSTTNTFACRSCTSDYYLSSTFQCLRRVARIPNCVSFAPDSDSCLVCGSGYFLAENRLSCTPYPRGISNCVSYLSATTCKECAPGFALVNRVCAPLTRAQEIPNCIQYADFLTCLRCSSSFASVNGACVPAIAQNCDTFLSASACASCKPGFGIKEEAGVINCVSNEIPNCQQTTSIFPFTCNVCSQGFFPQNGVCAPVVSTISNCLVYDSASTCAQCDPNSALSGDGKTCNLLFSLSASGAVSQNCQVSSIRAEHFCVACKTNFYFKNGACVPCETGVGCAGCLDSAPKVCKACVPGYEMGANNSCEVRGKGLRGLKRAHGHVSYLDHRRSIMAKKFIRRF